MFYWMHTLNLFETTADMLYLAGTIQLILVELVLVPGLMNQDPVRLINGQLLYSNDLIQTVQCTLYSLNLVYNVHRRTNGK